MQATGTLRKFRAIRGPSHENSSHLRNTSLAHSLRLCFECAHATFFSSIPLTATFYGARFLYISICENTQAKWKCLNLDLGESAVNKKKILEVKIFYLFCWLALGCECVWTIFLSSRRFFCKFYQNKKCSAHSYSHMESIFLGILRRCCSSLAHSRLKHLHW